MKSNDYHPIKRIDMKKWLLGGNSKIYAIILILFLAAVLFVLSSIPSIETAPVDDLQQEATTAIEPTSSYVADNQRYLIRINKAQNFVTIYTLDQNHAFTVIHDQFLCSVYTDVKLEDTTILDKTIWYQIGNSGYGHYASRLNNGTWMYSVPYTSQDISKLDTTAYNNLGKAALAGSIYMEAGKAKWIYENCGNGTSVEIYEDSAESLPAGLEELETVAAGTGYDPSDRPEFIEGAVTTPIDYMSVVKGVVIAKGSSYSTMDGVAAFDVYGNDISSYVRVEGTVNVNEAGVYQLYYILNDNFGTNLSYYREVVVTE